MKLEDMPVVTVEEVLRFRAEAIKQRNELAAVVERQREAMQKVLAISDRKHEAWDEAKAALSLTPATALRLHEAGVLERMRQIIRDKIRYCDKHNVELYHDDFDTLVADEIARLRAGGEG